MKKHSWTRQMDPGFSMVELVITLSVMMLTLAMAIPSLSDYLPLNALNGDVRAVSGLMQKAKFEAIRRNQAVNLEFVNAEPDSCVTYVDVNTNGSYDAGTDTLVDSYNLDQRIDYGTDATKDTGGASGTPGAIGFAGNNAIFNPDGTAAAGNLYLQFDASVVNANNQTKAVNVDSGGNVAVMVWKGCTSQWEDY